MDVMELCNTEETSAINDEVITRDLELCRQALNQTRHRKGSQNGIKNTLLQVLVIGVNRQVTDPFAAVVQSWGHSVRSAWNCTDARQIARAQQPHVVLLSIDRPLLDEYAIARCLRRDVLSSNCLVIAFTGWANDERRHLCEQSGIDLILVKPVEPAVLETLLTLEAVLVNRPSSVRASNGQRSRH